MFAMRRVVPSPAFDAYEPFAHAYDDFTADHDYEGWVSSLERVVLDAGLEGRRHLDVACGTGTSLVPWLDRGWATSGCDISPRMLFHAANKVRGRAHLFCADMRALPPGPRADLVTCLDDAVNYALEASDLDHVFASAARRVKRGGIYLFDVNGLRAFREDFASDRAFMSGGWRFRWVGHSSRGAAPGCVAAATIDATPVDPGASRAIRSRHVQRHHTVGRIRASLARAGMAEVGLYGQHRDGRLDSAFDELLHPKALVVARKL